MRREWHIIIQNGRLNKVEVNTMVPIAMGYKEKNEKKETW